MDNEQFTELLIEQLEKAKRERDEVLKEYNPLYQKYLALKKAIKCVEFLIEFKESFKEIFTEEVEPKNKARWVSSIPLDAPPTTLYR